jgi:hypothetical protein
MVLSVLIRGREVSLAASERRAELLEVGRTMPGTGDALRQTSDGLVRDLETLVQLEEEKRGVEPGDPRLVDLAKQIEVVAQRVLASSSSQRQQTAVINELADAGSPAAPDASIDDTPRSMEAILAAWREAERKLDAAQPGSAEAREAEILVERLREDYRRAHDEATRGRH